MADPSNKIDDLGKSIKELGDTVKQLHRAFVSGYRNVDYYDDSIQRTYKSNRKAKKGFMDLFHSLNLSSISMRDFTSAGYKLESMFSALISPLTLGIGGVGFGITSMIQEAHGYMLELQRLSNDFAGISDTYGGTANALSASFFAFNNSLGSLQTAMGAVKTLGEIGVRVTDDLRGLTVAASDLSMITGIGADQWAQFGGEINRQIGATSNDMLELSNIMVASGLQAGKLSTLMNDVKDNIHKISLVSGGSIKAVTSLTRGISKAAGVFNDLGVNAQKASEFIDNALDPEKFQENLELFARLGLTATDYFEALEKGPEGFIDTMMKNLPALASQIAQLPNPLQRIDFAKRLGIPLEIASKMAGKTRMEIEELLQTRAQDMEAQKAIEKKKQLTQADADKFQESMHWWKMSIFKPVMDFVQKNITYFYKLLETSGGHIQKVFGTIFNAIDKVIPIAFEFVNVLGIVIESLVTAFDPLIDSIGLFLRTTVIPFAQEYGPKAASFMAGIFQSIGKFVNEYGGLILRFGAAYAGLNIAKKFFDNFFGKAKSLLSGGKDDKDIYADEIIVNKISDGRPLRTGMIEKLFAKNSPFGKLIPDGVRNGVEKAFKTGQIFKNKGLLGLGESMLNARAAANIPMTFSGAGLIAESGAAGIGGAGSAGSLAAAAGPVAIVLAALAGGIYGFIKSGQMWKNELSYQEKETLNMIEEKKKLRQVLTDEEKTTYDRLKAIQIAENKRKELLEKDQMLRDIKSKMAYNQKLSAAEEKFFKDNIGNESALYEEHIKSVAEKMSSVAAGALSLGILPLIDFVFGTELTASFAKWLYPLEMAYAKIFVPISNVINDFVVGATPYIEEFSNQLYIMWSFFKTDLSIMFGEIWGTIKSVFDTFSNEVLIPIGKAFNITGDAAGGMSWVVWLLGKYLKGMALLYREVVLPIFKLLTKSVSGAVQNFGNMIKAIIKISSNIYAFFYNITHFNFSEAWDNIKSGFMAVFDLLKAAFVDSWFIPIKSMFQGWIGNIADFVEAMFFRLAAKLPEKARSLIGMGDMSNLDIENKIMDVEARSGHRSKLDEYISKARSTEGAAKNAIIDQATAFLESRASQDFKSDETERYRMLLRELREQIQIQKKSDDKLKTLNAGVGSIDKQMKKTKPPQRPPKFRFEKFDIFQFSMG